MRLNREERQEFMKKTSIDRILVQDAEIFSEELGVSVDDVLVVEQCAARRAKYETLDRAVLSMIENSMAPERVSLCSPDFVDRIERKIAYDMALRN